MSQQFLNQVLKIEDESAESTVASLLQAQSDSSEPCCICMQKIGILVSLLLPPHQPGIKVARSVPESIILSALSLSLRSILQKRC